MKSYELGDDPIFEPRGGRSGGRFYFTIRGKYRDKFNSRLRLGIATELDFNNKIYLLVATMAALGGLVVVSNT